MRTERCVALMNEERSALWRNAQAWQGIMERTEDMCIAEVLPSVVLAVEEAAAAFGAAIGKMEALGQAIPEVR